MAGEWKLERRVPARLTPAEGRKFGLLVGGAFIVLGLLLWYRGHSTGAWIVVPLGTLLIAAGLIAPSRLGPVYRGWNALALAISKVTTPIFMGVIYFLVLTPTGLLARLLGHRPLSRIRGEPTHWQNRPAGGTRGNMNHQF
jgi:hypothetical protein